MTDQNPHAKLFREMADRIEKNDLKDFAGAFLVVPPGDSGSLSGLLVGDADIASFFGMLKTKLDIAVTTISDEQRKLATYGPRR